jgi:hypothetical protein
MQKNLSLTSEELDSYQRLQLWHDEHYHPDILALGVSRRMNHIVLHLVKYLYPLSSLGISTVENRKAFIDSFIMVVSASNLLGIILAKEAVNISIDNSNTNFACCYIRLLAELAKSCEAADHQEDYPIRRTWDKNIRELFCLLVHEADLRSIYLLQEASHRLATSETNHPMSRIFRGGE